MLNININETFYILEWDTQQLIKDVKFSLSLRRLSYSIDGLNIVIPYIEWSKVETLDGIIRILNKFNIVYSLSNEINLVLWKYKEELDSFEEFTENASKIRDNMFDDNPHLSEYFNDFQKILSSELSRVLYPLQLLSSFHMAFSQNSCNFAVPWAWKTSIVYWAYAYLKSLPNDNPKHVDKLMIIWPLSSFRPWENEYIECFWKKTTVQRLSWDWSIKKTKKIEHLYSWNPSEITLINHWYINVLEKEIKDFLKSNKTMVVVDEAHRIKNSQWVWWISAIEIAKEANSRIILTWTPVPNWYEDLYNLYQFIYPYHFKKILWIHLDQLKELSKSDYVDEERINSFINRISPYFIRIKKSDLKLPWINEHKVYVDMDSSQREIYDYIESKYINYFKQWSSWSLKDVLNKAKLIRLRQACINPYLLNHTIQESLDKDDFDENYKWLPEEFQDNSDILHKIKNYMNDNVPKKYEKVLEIIQKEIIPNKQKVIIWTIFVQNAKFLQEYLKKNNLNSKLLIWEIETAERETTIDKFNDPNNNEFQVVIANPFSVAESISLHKWCHNAIYIERDYNCSNFLQSKDRIHRVWLNANQITNYYYIISKDSIDEIINDKLNEKIKRMEQIINQDIPLFPILDDNDENDIIKNLLSDYARRNK